MQVKLVRIGDSHGVRLPKSVLDQVGLTDVARLTVEGGRIVLEPQPDHPRAGWEEAFAGASHDFSEEDQDWLNADLTDDHGWTK